MNPARLAKAIQFAARAHRDQLRKGADTPYIAHPFAVGLLLSQHGFPEPIVVAGFLHDTLEDGGITDLYLLALARHHGAHLATFDRRIDPAVLPGASAALVQILCM